MNERERRAATAAPGSIASEAVPQILEHEPSSHPHTARFLVVYVLLAAAALGVIGLALHTATTVKPAPRVAVKHAWHPAGTTTFALAKSIAHHYTALQPAGFEVQGAPRITAERPAKIGLAALQIPTGQVMAQVAVLPTDVIYQLCGHGRECSLVEPPSVRRELRLRRLTLQLAVDTFSAAKPPKHVLISLPALPGRLWLVVYSRDEFNDKTLAKTHALLGRMTKAKHQRKRDLALLTGLTDGHVFSLTQQAVNEDQQVIFVLDSRACMDSACPGKD